MRSSSSPQNPPADSPLANAARWALVAAVFLVPLFWLPGFQAGFETPRTALVLAVIAPLAAWLLLRDPDGLRGARAPVWCLLAIIAAGLVPHVTGGFDVHTSWRSARALGPVAALVLAGAALDRPPWNRRLLLAILLTAIPVLAIGLLRRHQGCFAFLPDRPDVAIASTLGNSNALGEAFAPVFLAGLALFPAMGSIVARAAGWTATACALALVVVSHSRGAQLAVAAGVAVHAGIGCWRRRSSPAFRRAFLVSAIVLAFALGSFLALPAGRAAREYLASFVSTTAPTNAVRLSVWSGTLDLVRENLPLGAGLGRFEPAFLPHRRAAEWHLSGVDTRVDNPHQEFLWIASECGAAGLAVLVLLLLIALRRGVRSRALLLATVALVVLACVRAPLHHPSGALVFATLLGSVGPAAVGSGRRWTDFAAVVPFGAFLVLALLDAREDWGLGRAVATVNETKTAIARGDALGIRDGLLESGRRLKTVNGAILKDFDRSFRAALAEGDLADVKEAVRASVPPEACADLPDPEDVRLVLEETLGLCPNHPGATNQLALLWLKQGFVARAEATWVSAIQALPEAPRFRHNLASLYQRNDRFADAYREMEAEIRLKPAPDADDRALLAALGVGLGRDAATFGRYLAPPASAPTPAIRLGPATFEKRKELLLRLFDAPADRLALAELAQTDYELGSKGGDAEDLLGEANRAFARSRVRYALEALDAGDVDGAAGFLRLAVQKDPGLIDARFLKARVGARRGQASDAVENLKAVIGSGVSRAALQDRIARDADLAPLLASGALAALAL